jgi:hypothetical protein
MLVGATDLAGAAGVEGDAGRAAVGKDDFPLLAHEVKQRVALEEGMRGSLGTTSDAKVERALTLGMLALRLRLGTVAAGKAGCCNWTPGFRILAAADAGTGAAQASCFGRRRRASGRVRVGALSRDLSERTVSLCPYDPGKKEEDRCERKRPQEDNGRRCGRAWKEEPPMRSGFSFPQRAIALTWEPRSSTRAWHRAVTRACRQRCGKGGAG